jgi:arylsulfatase A-like enzyme
LLLAIPSGPDVRAAEGGDRPNIILVLTDDEDLASHRYLPRVKALIEDRGTVFENTFVPYPLCCPSRVSLLRGQYPHNTQVLGNRPPLGGFLTFRRLGHEDSTVATWLQEAGYRTAFYGKYLNGYTEFDAPPPGWDEWHAANNAGYQNVNYRLNENGEVVAYGDRPEDYLTDVIARKAGRHIGRFAREGRPFFLHISTFCPHSPYNPAERHSDLFQDVELPRPPSFDEEDVSDKPGFIRTLARLRQDQIDELTARHRRRLQCLQAVDDLVETVVGALDEAGELDDTYLVYTSDNGYHMGQHRMLEGKDTVYEEDIRVPFAIRGPGIAAGRTIGALTLTIDLAPTFVDWADATAPDFVDGRSLVPLLADPDTPWRRSFIVRRQGKQTDKRLRFSDALALRTSRYVYVAYADGERELYDLDEDPYQLHNIAASAEPGLIETMVTRLTRFRACSGQGCRAIENQPIE